MKQLPNTPVLVLTSLAKGADRLIESSKFRRRVKVCAVLPLEVDEYLKDFETKGEKDEFRRVLANCEMNLTMDSTSSKGGYQRRQETLPIKSVPNGSLIDAMLSTSYGMVDHPEALEALLTQ